MSFHEPTSGCSVVPMEGFVTALVVSGAAVVTARSPHAGQWYLFAAIRALTLLAAVLGLVALGIGFALNEWLTVSWAFGLTSCCLALGVPLGMQTWRRRLATIVVFTLSTIGVVICVEGLAPDAPWVISRALAHVTYRAGAQWVIVGNALLNLTALFIAAQRLR